MDIRPTPIADVLELTPVRYSDDRGWFSETANQRRLQAAGIDLSWLQDNESFSAKQGTLRGIHFQTEPAAQHKLVRAVVGSILDVAVDLRRSSPTFGHHVKRVLTADHGNQLFIPVGFGHAFLTLEPNCIVAYKVAGGYYSSSADAGIRWDDPDVGIDWPTDDVHLSNKDRNLPGLIDAASLFA